MNLKYTKKVLEVMQAFADGKKIEMQDAYGNWVYISDPQWNWSTINYRIKREPREPRVFWVNVYPNGPDSLIHTTRKAADSLADPSRTECIKVQEIIE